jgi:hypothetical protein
MVVAAADTHKQNRKYNTLRYHFQVLGLCACKPSLDLGFSVCVCVRACACVRARVRERERTKVRLWVCVKLAVISLTWVSAGNTHLL